MKQLTITEIRALNQDSLKQEIINIKKILFDFRLKQATRQSVKPHVIRAYKKQLARIMTIEHEKFINK